MNRLLGRQILPKSTFRPQEAFVVPDYVKVLYELAMFFLHHYKRLFGIFLTLFPSV